jgi:TniQ
VPPVFEAWNLAVRPVIERSRLYSLPPIGLGTAFVECLSSYVVRLAKAHAVSTTDLVRRELSRHTNPPLVFYSHGINGLGACAARWIEVLERTTSRSDLRYLTLRPFEHLFSNRVFLRPMRAWCPECYREMDTTGTFGEQLLWCIRAVEACPRHHCLLETVCRYCNQPFRQLYAGSRVGCCSSCGTELRCIVAEKTDKTLGDAPTKYQLWVADAVGQLLAHAPELRPETLLQRVRTVLTHYVQEFGGGNCAAVAETARCHVGVFYEWLYGRTKPQIENLLQAWYHLNLPFSLISSPNDQLLPWKEGNLTRVKAEVRQNVRTRRRSRDQIPGTSKIAKQKKERIAAIEPTFQRALRENPPPPIHKVCQRIGLSPARVKVLAPGLFARFEAWRRECAEGRRAELLNQLKGVLYETPPPSAHEVYMRLGITNSIAFHNFPELRRAIIERRRQYRHQQSCALQKAAREEIREIVQTLSDQGVCPSAMRVWGLAKKKSFLKWGPFAQAVHDARKSLNTLQIHLINAPCRPGRIGLSRTSSSTSE